MSKFFILERACNDFNGGAWFSQSLPLTDMADLSEEIFELDRLYVLDAVAIEVTLDSKGMVSALRKRVIFRNKEKVFEDWHNIKKHQFSRARYQDKPMTLYAVLKCGRKPKQVGDLRFVGRFLLRFA